VTWICTPDQLEELATGWLHGEGYIRVARRPGEASALRTDLGFWAEVKPERVAPSRGENRKRVLASGAGPCPPSSPDPHQVAHAPARGEPPAPERLRALFKDAVRRGERSTSRRHPRRALTDDERLLFPRGRHRAPQRGRQVVGAAVLAREPITGRGLLVTGRISAELAYRPRAPGSRTSRRRACRRRWRSPSRGARGSCWWACGERDAERPPAGRVTAEALRDILDAARTIAVVGLSPTPTRPRPRRRPLPAGRGLPDRPVNPGHTTILGEQS